MFNSYYKRPKTTFKYKRYACSALYLTSFFILISSGTEDFTVDIIKDAVCIAVIAIAAITGNLSNIKEESKNDL